MLCRSLPCTQCYKRHSGLDGACAATYLALPSPVLQKNELYDYNGRFATVLNGTKLAQVDGWGLHRKMGEAAEHVGTASQICKGALKRVLRGVHRVGVKQGVGEAA